VTDDVRDPEPAETDWAATEDTTDVPDTDAVDDDTVDDETVDDDAVDDDAAPTKRPRRHLHLRLPPMLRKIITATLVALLIISGGFASWVYFKQYRPDQQTDSGVKQAVVDAASDGTVAVLSYSSDTLDQDFASAKSHLGGEFLPYYVQFTQQTVGPAAKEKKLKTTAKVMGAAVSELHPDSAVVLVFVDQTTNSKDSPQPLLATSSVVLHLNRVEGNWLITKFTPI
jgi:Mce-associated membrane protein